MPPGNDQDIFLVLGDFGGRIGQAWRETDVESTRLETIIGDLLDGQYSKRYCFQHCGGLVRDVSEDVAHELQRSCTEMERDLPSSLEEFAAKYQANIAPCS